MELGEGVGMGSICNNVNNKKEDALWGIQVNRFQVKAIQRLSELSQEVVSFLPFKGKKGGHSSLC